MPEEVKNGVILGSVPSVPLSAWNTEIECRGDSELKYTVIELESSINVSEGKRQRKMPVGVKKKT